MVFSHTSLETQSNLKVVELNRLKPENNGKTQVISGGSTGQLPDPVATNNLTEVFLKPEPQFESTITMFNETDCEFFQDLMQWCSDPAKEEPGLTDSIKRGGKSSQNTDTLHTTFSPQGWDIDANSPVRAGFYSSTPNDPLSPNMDVIASLDNKFLYTTHGDNKKNILEEEIWDIPNLPVVLEDLASEKTVDLNPCAVTEPVDYYITHESHDTEYTPTINTHKMFINDEDSLDGKLSTVTPREVENNNVVISEYIVSNDQGKVGVLQRTRSEHRGTGLSLELPSAAPWFAGAISTPEVLNYVEQLEKEKCILPVEETEPQWALQDTGFESMDTCSKTVSTTFNYDCKDVPLKTESLIDSDPEDTKSYSGKRKRRNSEDSDESYTPYSEHTPRKNKRRKPSIPIKDMILALEEARQVPKRRGRPPKRRESTVSSVCSVDDNASTTSTHEIKYRELRDKNNEASKRSRMNRKLKELQMEQLADELEERNKKLKVKADILEDMTKKLKEALMSAILQK